MSRLIDKVEGKREVDLELLCLGFSRTGTRSLRAALSHFGYNPYRVMAILDKVHLECWDEAMQAKFQGKGKQYGKEEFDKLMGKYNVRSIRVHQTFTEPPQTERLDADMIDYILLGHRRHARHSLLRRTSRGLSICQSRPLDTRRRLMGTFNAKHYHQDDTLEIVVLDQILRPRVHRPLPRHVPHRPGHYVRE